MPKSRSRSDFLFRIGTGTFGVLLVVLVCAIGVVLARQSVLSVQKFGMNFWRTEIWDPVAGEFGALPFIWGTLYSSVLALLIATPIALGIAVFISELCPAVLRQPLVFITELLAAIPSIVYGLWGIFVLVPAVRAVERSLPDAMRQLPLFSGPLIGAVMLGFGRALGETMAVTMVIGNNPKVSVSLFAPQYTMAAVIANEFAEAADDLYLSALVEIGLVLFIITLIINSLSRLLIWSMARSATAAREPAVAAEAAA